RPTILPSRSAPAVWCSPDGRLVLSAGLGGTVRLLSPNWETLAQLQPPAGTAGARKTTPPASQTEARSRDGRRLLKAGDDNSAGLFDASSGRPLTPPLRHGSKVLHVAFSPDEQRVLTCSDDNTARLWDAATGRL